MNQTEKDELLVRLDERTKTLVEKFDTFLETNQKMEDRLCAVERWQWKANGFSAAIGALGGSLAWLFLGKGGA